MSTEEQIRTARLEAISAVRAILANEQSELAAIVVGSDDHAELAHAATGLTASVIAMMPPDAQGRILDQLTASVVAPGGGQP